MFKDLSLIDWTGECSKKQSTPGGGAAAATAASIGASIGIMAARYTTGEKYAQIKDSVDELILLLESTTAKCFLLANEDANAYKALQKSWKDKLLSLDEKNKIEEKALGVPVDLFSLCRDSVLQLNDFIPKCNKYLLSDVFVAIHILSGAAKSAFQMVLVNTPSDLLKTSIQKDIERIIDIERDIL